MTLCPSNGEYLVGRGGCRVWPQDKHSCGGGVNATSIVLNQKPLSRLNKLHVNWRSEVVPRFEEDPELFRQFEVPDANATIDVPGQKELLIVAECE